jgi:NAD(P)-dependent dehydrogenase (short-subunit alcohol dehydrogenase family)
LEFQVPIDFSGQAAIVTGAGSGIGRAIALALAARGARVLVNDPAGDGRAEAVCAEIRSGGGVATAEMSPVGSHESARCIAQAALTAFGRTDILVNNAGISRPAPFGDGADREIDLVLATNLLGPYALMRAVWPAMRSQGHGRILNTSSNAAFGSGVSGPYAASKAGLIGLTKDAAISGRPLGIVINALMPSASTSLLDKHPDATLRAWMAANMPPEHVAAAAVWLVSREMTITGEIFAAGGGHVSRLAFIESKGVTTHSPTPDFYLSQAETIADMRGGRIVSTQFDHQANTARALPGYPL